MAYNEELARRIGAIVEGTEGIAPKKMFGGLAYLDRGHMACGIVGDELMVRVGPDAYEAALREPHVRPMDFTGRSMKGMIYVSGEGIASDHDLERWVKSGLNFTGTLPPKKK